MIKKSNPSLIINFAKIISGKYSNFLQSQSNSKDFANINIYFRPVSWSILNNPCLYSEQSYEYDPWSPYKQSIIKVLRSGNNIVLENYSLNNAERVAGAGEYPTLLREIYPHNLKLKSGCSMYFNEVEQGLYLGSIEPGKKCLIERKGKTTYLDSYVRIDQNQLISKDQGFDKLTNKQIWGSEKGAFLFKKIISFQNEINEIWLSGGD